MNRSILLIGLAFIVLMLLVPPFETGAVNQIGDMLQGDQARAIEYSPVWSDPAGGGHIAGRRLLLQILAVGAGTLGIAYYRT